MVVSVSGALRRSRQPQPRLALTLLPTDGSVPNTLVIANVEVIKPRVAAAEHILQFNEEAHSPFVKKVQNYNTSWGGKDKSVILWSIQDHLSTLGEASATKSRVPSSGNSGSKQAAKVGNERSIDSPTVGPRGVFQGHEDTVDSALLDMANERFDLPDRKKRKRFWRSWRSSQVSPTYLPALPSR